MNISIRRTDDHANALPRKGRLTLGGEHVQLSTDVSLGATTLSAGVHYDPSDTTAGLDLASPLGSVNVRLSAKVLRHLRAPSLRVGAGLDWSEEDAPSLFWEAGSQDGHMQFFDVMTPFFGAQRTEQVVRGTVLADLLLPEKAHPCVISFFEVATWREKAPTFLRRVQPGAEIVFADPPQIPAKIVNLAAESDPVDWIPKMFVTGSAAETTADVLADAYRRVMHRRSEVPAWKPNDRAPSSERQRIVEQHVLTSDWPQIDTVGRWLGARAGNVRVYSAADTALLVVRADKTPALDILQNAIGVGLLNQILDRTKKANVHVALVVGGRTLHRVTWGKGAEAGKIRLVPFDLTLWPGSVAAFLP